MSQPPAQPAPVQAPPTLPVLPPDWRIRSKSERKSCVDQNAAKQAVELKQKHDAQDKSVIDELKKWADSPELEKLESYTVKLFSKATRDKLAQIMEAALYDVQKFTDSVVNPAEQAAHVLSVAMSS